MTLPNPYPVARYRLDCQVQTPLRLPEYAGSALRGAFGQALRRTACMTRQPDCTGCPLLATCPYPAIFAPPPPKQHDLQRFSQIPVPFVVEPPPWGERHYAPGDRLVFHVVVIGRALAQMPLILYAWQRALEHGIGPGDGRAELQTVAHLDVSNEQIVYRRQDGQWAAHQPQVAINPGRATDKPITLRVTTPLRLQDNGRPLRPQALTPRHLLVQLTRRIALLTEFHGGQPLGLDYPGLARRAQAVRQDKDLAWRDWTRYSSRQKQEMTLGGVVGSWTLTGDLDPFLPLLRLGQWLHAGKNASFGLGQFYLVEDGGLP